MKKKEENNSKTKNNQINCIQDNSDKMSIDEDLKDIIIPENFKKKEDETKDIERKDNIDKQFIGIKQKRNLKVSDIENEKKGENKKKKIKKIKKKEKELIKQKHCAKLNKSKIINKNKIINYYLI